MVKKTLLMGYKWSLFIVVVVQNIFRLAVNRIQASLFNFSQTKTKAYLPQFNKETFTIIEINSKKKYVFVFFSKEDHWEPRPHEVAKLKVWESTV